MRVKRKVISVLELSKREIELLFEMVEEAKAGHTIHYSERQTGHNQFFGVSVDEQHDEIYRQPKMPLPKMPEYVNEPSKY